MYKTCTSSYTSKGFDFCLKSCLISNASDFLLTFLCVLHCNFWYLQNKNLVILTLTFLAHLSRRLEWAIVIAHRPSSVRPSVVRPSGVNFHIFNFSSETAERNSTKLDRKQDLNALYQVCVFWADRKNKMAALASDWLRHFRLLLWNRWKEFKETWQEARLQHPLPSLCFSGRSEKQDGRPGLWLAETFSTSPLKPLNGIQRKLDRKQDLNALWDCHC